MENVIRLDRDRIDPRTMQMWRMPGWTLEKGKFHPFGKFYLNVGMNAEAFVAVNQFGDVVSIKIWPYYHR